MDVGEINNLLKDSQLDNAIVIDESFLNKFDKFKISIKLVIPLNF